MLRFVGHVLSTAKKNVVGIVLDEPRKLSSQSRDGYYQGVKVVECPTGFGFVAPVEDFERMIVTAVSDGNSFWVCKECCHVNPTPLVTSLDEYLNMPVEILDILLRCRTCPAQLCGYISLFCGCSLYPLTARDLCRLSSPELLCRAAECNTVRVWLCPHPTCSNLPGLEVADIRGALLDDPSRTEEPKVIISSVHETMTCPRCMRPPLSSWPCPQCQSRNIGLAAQSR